MYRLFTSGFFLFMRLEIQTLLSDCAFYILDAILNILSMVDDVCMICIDTLIKMTDIMSDIASIIFKVSDMVFNPLRFFLDISSVA